jgi:hypothetical protein
MRGEAHFVPPFGRSGVHRGGYGRFARPPHVIQSPTFPGQERRFARQVLGFREPNHQAHQLALAVTTLNCLAGKPRSPQLLEANSYRASNSQADSENAPAVPIA